MTGSAVDIRKNWRHIKLKYVARLVSSRADSRPDGMPYVGMENIESHTGRLINAQQQDDEQPPDGISTVNLFEEGDVLFGKLRPYLAKAWLCSFSGASTTEALVLRPGPDIVSRYLLHTILSTDFIREVDTTTFGSKMPRADWDNIGNLAIHLPPLEKQEGIVRYLQSTTTTIDSLIAAKQHLIDLLAEKRSVLIERIITKGLDAELPHSDSGIPWLGNIPVHWQTERAKWLFTERDDRSESGDEMLLSVSHLTGVTSRAEKNVNMFMAESLEGYKRCETGDLVINTLWAWMGAMGVTRQPGIVSPAYNVYRPVPELDPEYLDLLVRTPRFAEEITRYSKGVWSSRMRLYPEGLYEAWLPVPPKDEQHAIVAHIKQETQKIDAFALATEKTITLLQERRSALISAAVTGQIEIGGKAE
jgi:type I restriction enzyme S subunit